MSQISQTQIERDLPSLLKETVARHGRSTAIRFAGRDVDFATFDAVSDRIAAALAVRGIRKGDRIGLYCVNSDAFAMVYFGIIKAGAVVVPINVLLKPNEIEYILNDAQAVGLVYHELFAPAVSVFRNSVPSLKTLVHIGAQKSAPTDLSWTEFTAVTDEAPQVVFDPVEDVASILYTSGTTGQPKGAMLTHRNLAANCRSVMDAMHFTSGHDVILVVLPMFHAFAATAGMLTPLLYGLAFAPVPKFDPLPLAEAIAGTGSTVFLGVPSMFNALMRLPDSHVEKLSGLRFCVTGGAAMPVELMKRFEQRFHVPLYEGYGPTECAPVVSVNPIDGAAKPGSVGLPLSQVEVSIRDEHGNELATEQTGEICVRGPNVMNGYWQRPEDTQASFYGAWFRTGDLGRFDPDGYLYIVDRIKDLVIINGMNVYPRKVEDVLYEDTRVQEAAVVGEPHSTHGEIPVAYVVLQPGAEATTSADIRKFASERLGSFEVPRKIYFVKQLPKNAAGKVLKRELRQMGGATNASGAGAPPAADPKTQQSA